ncbi:hypothetical protein Tco_1469196, partial [Tanacetum coccineum]
GGGGFGWSYGGGGYDENKDGGDVGGWGVMMVATVVWWRCRWRWQRDEDDEGGGGAGGRGGEGGSGGVVVFEWSGVAAAEMVVYGVEVGRWR